MLAILFECTLRSAALALMVWLLLRALRVRSPRVERDAWRAVLAASLAMPFLMEMVAVPVASVPGSEWLREVQTLAFTAADSNRSWHSIGSWSVAGISGLLFLRHTAGVARWWMVRRRAQPVRSPLFPAQDIRVAREATGSATGPATVFSTILVPVDFSAWSPEVQRLVIAHEQTHIENKDFYVQWLAHVHRCLFWFNPLAWWLVDRLSLLSEHVSDEAAVRGTNQRAEYARLLLSFARTAVDVDQPVAMVRTSSLARRIEKILLQATPARFERWQPLMIVGVLLPMVVIIAGFGSVAARGEISRESLSSARGDLVALSAAGAKIVLPKSDPTKPLSPPAYPSASRRLGEHGTVVLKLHVLEDGSVADAIIEKTSGHPDLDYAALYEAFRWRLAPGTIDDTPSRMWGQFAVTFKLAD
jgi:TonB family protein